MGAGMGILLPAMVLAFFQITSKLDREIDLRVRAPMLQYAEVLSRGLSAAIWNVDKGSADQLIEAVMRNPDVVRISVVDEYQQVFAQQERPAISDLSLLQAQRAILHNGTRVGHLQLALSTERVKGEMIADMVKVALALAAQVLISFVFIWWLFDRRMVRPLQALQQGAQRLALGKLDEPLQWRRDDEIGKLAHGLDSMRSNLATLIAEREQKNATLQDELEAKHRYEAQILELNTTLEQRVSERTRELTEAMAQLTTAQDELVRAEKMSALGALVAGIAHELNTPIGNSLTVASTLQDHANEFALVMAKGLTRSRLDEFVSSTRQGTGILMRSLHQAAELVSSFKQVAVDQTSLNRRKFGLNEMVHEILLTLGPSLRKTTHYVECQIASDITLDSYPGPLGQIVTNLVNNALLHAFDGRQNGLIKISALRVANRAVEICVSDNGCGIPASHLAKVFDPFFTTKLGKGGSGLGLNIVYNLASTTLGGSIRVQSITGAGASFILTLPLEAP
jgi:signal transduction histidine kinase